MRDSTCREIQLMHTSEMEGKRSFSIYGVDSPVILLGDSIPDI